MSAFRRGGVPSCRNKRSERALNPLGEERWMVKFLSAVLSGKQRSEGRPGGAEERMKVEDE